MSRITTAFDHGKAFIAFITCGDPDLDTTKALIETIAAAGADLIELGVPFSDPTAEGLVIQGANQRALDNGVTTDAIFRMIREVRENVSIPMVFMTYANVVFSYGTERFLRNATDIGMDGLILPDVPYEEKTDFAPACADHGLDLISLVAPTSKERAAMIAKEATGFVYCVSSLGVTGVRNEITADVGAMIKLIRENTNVPAAIGFGISTPEQAAAMAEIADGVIVGSAIVKLVENHGKDAIPYVYDYVKAIKSAIR